MTVTIMTTMTKRISSKLEKAMTIGGFIVGALIICVLIYFIGKAAGILNSAVRHRTTDSTVSAAVLEATSSVGFRCESCGDAEDCRLTEETAQTTAAAMGLGIKHMGEKASEDYPGGNHYEPGSAEGTKVQKNTTITYYRSRARIQLLPSRQ